jgi:hypothetical protein
MAVMKAAPANPKAGRVVITTKVINHPLLKAMAKPVINMPIVIKIVDNFYPIAP